MERARLIFLLSFVVLSNYFGAKKICFERLKGVFEELEASRPLTKPPTNHKVNLWFFFPLFCKNTTSIKVLHRSKATSSV